jgi:hypothetical protein
VPRAGWTEARRAASKIPDTAARNPDRAKTISRTFFTSMPAKVAPAELIPEAWTRRPKTVAFSSSVQVITSTKPKTIGKGTPAISP